MTLVLLQGRYYDLIITS